MAPSKFLGLGFKPWGETDFLLTMALEEHEASLCAGGCGQYSDEAHDDDAEGWYEADDSVQCHACAARQILEKRSESQEPGQMIHVYDARIHGFEAHTKRPQPAPKPVAEAVTGDKGGLLA